MSDVAVDGQTSLSLSLSASGMWILHVGRPAQDEFLRAGSFPLFFSFRRSGATLRHGRGAFSIQGVSWSHGRSRGVGDGPSPYL